MNQTLAPRAVLTSEDKALHRRRSGASGLWRCCSHTPQTGRRGGTCAWPETCLVSPLAVPNCRIEVKRQRCLARPECNCASPVNGTIGFASCPGVGHTSKNTLKKRFQALPASPPLQSPNIFCFSSRRCWASRDKVAVGRANKRPTPMASPVSSQNP